MAKGIVLNVTPKKEGGEGLGTWQAPLGHGYNFAIELTLPCRCSVQPLSGKHKIRQALQGSKLCLSVVQSHAVGR
jgi:hypothetical protein